MSGCSSMPGSGHVDPPEGPAAPGLSFEVLPLAQEAAPQLFVLLGCAPSKHPPTQLAQGFLIKGPDPLGRAGESPNPNPLSPQPPAQTPAASTLHWCLL